MSHRTSICITLAFALFASPLLAGSGPKVLNNLVTELLHVSNATGVSETGYTFTNPRDGWVFIKAALQSNGDIETTLTLDPGPTAQKIFAGRGDKRHSFEAMRYLPAGLHVLAMHPANRANEIDLVVRAVPELLYSSYGANPQVTEYGTFDLAYLRHHALANLNTIIGPGENIDTEFLDAWKKAGKRYLVEVYATPYFQKWPAERAYEYWKENPGLANPLLDGIIIDEFAASNDPVYAAITESVRKVHATQPDKLVYPYCGAMFGHEASEAFAKVIIECGYRLAWERYLVVPEEGLPARSTARAWARRCVYDGAGRLQVLHAAHFRAMPGTDGGTIVPSSHRTSAQKNHRSSLRIFAPAAAKTALIASPCTPARKQRSMR